MQFVKTDNRYIIRLALGENFSEQLLKLCEKEEINTAFFYGLGATLSSELAYYNLRTNKYQNKQFDKTLEIVSLTGNITTVDKKPFIHAHIVLSDENYNCFGGHLKDAMIGGTCEIYLTKEELKLSRKDDTQTGLKLIDCGS